MQYALAINSGCVAGGQCPLLEAEADIPPTHPLRPSLTHLGSPANRARNIFVRTARGVCSFSPKFSPKILRRAFDEEHDMPEFLSEADRAELEAKSGGSPTRRTVNGLRGVRKERLAAAARRIAHPQLSRSVLTLIVRFDGSEAVHPKMRGSRPVFRECRWSGLLGC